MKGNNGKAARRKLVRRLVVIVAFFAILIVLLKALGIGRRSSSGRNLRKPRPAHHNGGSPHAQHHTKDPNHGGRFRKMDRDAALRKILNAELHLVDLSFDMQKIRDAPEDGYAGVSGDFCELDWSLHKTNPSKYPMFRDIVMHSPECTNHRFTFDLAHIAKLAKERDAKVQQRLQDASTNDDAAKKATPKVLDLTGVAFHESRCGSTLVANTLIGMDPQHHRVYSESSPPIRVFNYVHGQWKHSGTRKQFDRLFRDVIYLMSRTNDEDEERVFFKFQSATTYHIADFVHAFPQTPWMFVYRDPVQVMMSHTKDGLKQAVCTRSRKQPPNSLLEILNRHGIESKRKATLEEYCAAHLAGIVEAATEELDKPASMGIPINYADLPQRLYEEILPQHMGITVTETMVKRIRHVTSFYAKGRDNRAGIFHSDNEAKEDAATPKIQKAAATFLQDSYDFLKRYEREQKAELNARDASRDRQANDGL